MVKYNVFFLRKVDRGFSPFSTFRTPLAGKMAFNEIPGTF
jgi:hypothetical protein